VKLPALVLTVAAATLLMAPATPQDKANPPTERIEESAKKIKELRKERIDILEKLVETTAELFKVQRARVPYEDVLEAQLLLLPARLDAAEKESDRVKLYEQTIAVLKQLEKLAENNVVAGRGTQVPVYKTKARRLEAEIQLEQAKIKEAKQSK
jgi:hypothetical protein